MAAMESGSHSPGVCSLSQLKHKVIKTALNLPQNLHYITTRPTISFKNFDPKNNNTIYLHCGALSFKSSTFRYTVAVDDKLGFPASLACTTKM